MKTYRNTHVFLYKFVLVLSIFVKAYHKVYLGTDPYIRGSLKPVPLLRYKRLVFNELQ